MAGLPEGIEFCMAIEDYSDEMNNICLHKEESVIVLDKLSFPGMYKVLKFHSDGSSGDEIWVPENILQRKTSTAEITLAKGKLSLFKGQINPNLDFLFFESHMLSKYETNIF